MKLKIRLDYKLDNAQEKPQETTYNLFSLLVASKNPNGVEGQYRRMWGRIQRKFDDCVSRGDMYIELENGEFDLLKEAIRDGKCPAVFSKHIVLLEEAMEAAEKKNKTK